MEKKDKIPTGIEKIEKRMEEIESKILEMRAEEEKAKKRAAKARHAKEEEKKRKERMKNHWMMMGWLTRYIEKNKYNWERRRELQEKDKELMAEYEEWREQDPEEQIEHMKKEEEQRLSRVVKSRKHGKHACGTRMRKLRNPERKIHALNVEKMI